MAFDFTIKAKKFVAVNGSPAFLDVTFGGNTVRVPAKDEVGTVRPPYEVDGVPVPGTAVFQDGVNPESGVVGWDAGAAIRHWLNIEDGTGKPSSVWWKKGFSALPFGASLAEVAEEKALATTRFQEWIVASSREYINLIDAENEARRKRGVPEIPGGRDYIKGAAILQAAVEQERDLARAALGIRPKDEDEDLVAFAKKTIEAAAARAAKETGADPVKVAEDMVADPEVMKHVEKKYQEARKK